MTKFLLSFSKDIDGVAWFLSWYIGLLGWPGVLWAGEERSKNHSSWGVRGGWCYSSKRESHILALCTLGTGEAVGICLETTVIACLSIGGWGQGCL